MQRKFCNTVPSARRNTYSTFDEWLKTSYPASNGQPTRDDLEAILSAERDSVIQHETEGDPSLVFESALSPLYVA